MSGDSVASAFRRWGYLQAQLDPLGRLQPVPVAELDDRPASEAAHWRRIYCGSMGAEFMHLVDPLPRAWLAEQLESQPGPVDRERLLHQLATAELFEGLLHARYVGTKRYSLEGAAALVPLLNGILDRAADQGIETALIAMSHRGRLTVMLQTVRIPAADLFAGFEDFVPRMVLGGGDLKYHHGATGTYDSASGKPVAIHLVSNPSHLEAVNPVVMGRVRARQERLGGDGHKRVLCITIHGDAAFAGQGIAAETLNLSRLPGFSVGGTIQIIVNNLIGFTTEPESLHSSRFSSDMAHRLPIPILHVNGEDPEAVVRTGRLALDFRNVHGSDVVIDMICYRRYGHSEVDDPTTTQPLLYRRIADRPRLWQDYGERLGKTSVEMAALRHAIESELQRELEHGRAMGRMPVLRRLPAYWDPYQGGPYRSELEVETHVPLSRIEAIARRMASIPENFNLHPKVRTRVEERLEMGLGKRNVDWSMAEALAFGSLLWDGVPVRLSGQDSQRGTFNQRHAVLVDFDSGSRHIPLCHLHERQARFDIHNSTLSEASELGFAYGFSRDYPEALVCWEAQFGDFVNGAQVIIDQFVSAAEDKWDLLSGLVLLLPHGYEGQGPEHSSARLERFLQLAAEDNMQVCQPSTAAQYFHVLRRQVLRRWRKPLVILAPKGSLRSPTTSSTREELGTGGFRPVLPDPEHGEARRLLICTGKIVHELRAERDRRGDTETAILALEQIYPFPEEELAAEIQRHAAARIVIWVQEEPANMGALFFVRPILQRLAGDRTVTTVRRSASASPSTGSAKAHALEQKTLLELAFARFRSWT